MGDWQDLAMEILKAVMLAILRWLGVSPQQVRSVRSELNRARHG